VEAQPPLPCTFVPDTDYNADGKAVPNTPTQQECCDKCAADPQCVVGVLSGTTCWFKYSDADPVPKAGVTGCATAKITPIACTVSNDGAAPWSGDVTLAIDAVAGVKGRVNNDDPSRGDSGVGHRHIGDSVGDNDDTSRGDSGTGHSHIGDGVGNIRNNGSPRAANRDRPAPTANASDVAHISLSDNTPHSAVSPLWTKTFSIGPVLPGHAQRFFLLNSTAVAAACASDAAPCWL
jgi:hypothetical protein